MRLIGFGLAAMLFGAPVAMPAAPQIATALLATTRDALGGAAALDAVRSFSARGSIDVMGGGDGFRGAVTIDVVLPDRYLRTTRQALDGPLGGGSVTNHTGFNVDRPIQKITAENLPPPPAFIGGPTSPDEIAALDARRLAGSKRTFVPLFLSLFAASPSTYPLTFSSPGRLDLPDGPVDLVEALDAGDGAWLLFIDPETRLTRRITWMAPPRVVVSRQSVVAVNRGSGETRTLSEPEPLPANPTAGMSDVEHIVELQDYRLVEGRLWPHRLTFSAGGETYETIRISEYAINPEIDLAIFDISG